LEQIFGGVVFCRGNAIMLDSDSGSKRQEFRRLIQTLEGLASRGESIEPELIQHFLDPALLDGQAILIPHGQRIFPRNNTQAQMIRSVRTNPLTFSLGPAGTGKTFLAVALGLAEVLSKRRRKLILTRPVVEAGENLGFLPGDLAQKISPYLRPLYDAMEDLIPGDLLQRLEDLHQIEIAPLAYMRGRSLKNCFIILDEAQNTTRGQMKMFLTRLGEGAKAVVTGDLSQIDLPRNQDCGLLEAQRILKHIPEIGFIEFTSNEVMRSPLVKAIINAYESSE
jgi:phosphate starvation-inducible PhoH-like protein